MNDHVDPTVKKRSLSNYLSNVNTRREELEKLKQRQEKEKQESERHQIALEQQRILEEQERQKEEERKRIEQAAQRGKVDNEEQDSQREEHGLLVNTEQRDIENNNSFQQHVKDASRHEEELKSTVSTDRKESETNETNTGHQNDKIDKAHIISEDVERPKNETLSRNELHAILKEPEVRQDLSRVGEESEHEKLLEDESEEDVASDAPTEPASPPKPRRRRLIRGDKLSSLSPRHSTFDNDSDSELSDIDELKSVQISSSFIHGDSSPVRDAQDSRRRFHQPSSPRLVRRTASPKKLHHVAVPKVSKQKKGIYRDAGGRNRLQIACDKGNYDVAKKLLEEDDYDVNDQDNAGNTALHEAALNGHLDLVKLLVKHGADVNIQSFEMFKDTPLIDASANGHLDVVKYLLAHGSDPTICNAKGLTAFESIEDSDLDEHEREIVGEIKRNLRTATKNWKDINGKNNVPSTNYSGDHTKLRQRSEELMGDFEFFWTDITSRAGKDKLFKASKEGKLSYVGAYLENGGKIDLKSFFEAVKFGHEDITSLFLAFGAHVNAISKSGTTALICAVGRGHVGTVKLLLEAGADPNKKDKNGHTPLYYAKNSPMGVVSAEEIALLKRAIEKSNSSLKEEEKSEKNIFEYTSVENEDHRANHKESEEHEDDENVISVARKRRAVSPDRHESKKQTVSRGSSSPVPLIDPQKETLGANSPSDSKPYDKGKSESESAKIREETPEEKEQRLRAEEEYIQRRLQNKKKKEQELLKKLALDEEKREKEKAHQKVEEAKKLQERERLKQIELSKKNKEAELIRRREIRSLYPLGLRMVDFNDAEDYADYLPLYVVQMGEDGSNYALDLQICIILKDIELLASERNVNNSIPVRNKHKKQLWNILKFIFLYGGSQRASIQSPSSLHSRIQFEQQEYAKFSNLPMHWVKLQDIKITDNSKRQRIEQSIVQIELVNQVEEPASSLTLKDTTTHNLHVPRRPTALPSKFQKRHKISYVLQDCSAQPMW